MQFGPQTVEANSWRTWAVEGLQLSARRPVVFLILTLLYAGLDYLPSYLNGVQFWLTPLFLGLGCFVAQCADESRSVGDILAGVTRHAWFRLISTGLVPLAGFVIFSIVATPDPLPPVIFKGGLGILIMMFFWMLFAGPFLWFLVPLVAVGGLSVPVASAQSMNALRQNFFVYGLTMAVTFLSAAMITLGASIIAVPLYPILCCAMYVSYRHIWLNRAQNEPEEARVRAQATATA